MVKNRKITKAQVNKMKKLRENGLSYSKISLKLQIGETSVRYHLDDNFKEKVKLANKYKSEERKEYQKNYRNERYQSDPKFREKQKKRSRNYQRKIKKNQKESKK